MPASTPTLPDARPVTLDDRRTLDLDIQGMTCASCAARIEKRLNKVDGVQASVNYATERAHVLAPAVLPTADLIDVVRKAGYDASEPVPDAPAVDHAAALRRRLIVSAALAVPVVLMAMVTPLQFPGWQWASLALATPVVLWCGWPFHRSAVVNARHRATTMDTLVSVGTLTAFLWSLYALVLGHAGTIGMRHEFSLRLMRTDPTANVYFEAAVGIITFLLLGRYIEARSRRSAGSALRALLELGVRQATVLRDGAEVTIPVRELAVGDLFLVRPGQRVASDGVVVEGHSALDAALITGESVPVEVGPGDAVVGATVNTTGALTVRATAVGDDTQLAQIAHLVEAAQTGKANAQRLADKVSAVFVPTVMALALLALVGWLVAGAGWGFALSAAIAVLIIACPCALGLATPTALLAGTGRGAELGIVISGPEALERAAGVRTVLLDKTGTLTTGRMAVTATHLGDDAGTRAVVTGRLLALESRSDHPVAQAIVRDVEGTPDAGLAQVTEVPGRGVRGLLPDGTTVVAGTPRFLESEGLTIPDSLQAPVTEALGSGASIVLIGWDGTARGMVGVSDTLKSDAATALARLRGLGLHTVMLTGDQQAAADHVAGQLLDGQGRRLVDDVRAGVLPEDKLATVTHLQESGQRVAMVGDGVNDAAALAAADLGVALGTGTDAARAASDITVMRPDLGLAADAIVLSRRTLRTIKSNLFWAFAYNVVAIPLAALGFLTPMVAGACMAFSSVFVVLNSLRLKGFGGSRGPSSAPRQAIPAVPTT